MSDQPLRMADQIVSQPDKCQPTFKKLFSSLGSDQELSVSGLSTPAEVVPVEATPEVTPEVPRNKIRRGKAPLVDSYTGEDTAILLDDWLPILERAAKWNGRSSCYS